MLENNGMAGGEGLSVPSKRSAVEALIAPPRQQAIALAAEGNLGDASDAWKVVLTIDPGDTLL